MPKMMPPDFDPEWSPVSEEIVFRAVQENLPDDWYVFHSFHFISDDRQGKKHDGEIDFLFYHPIEGIVVMEVKGGCDLLPGQSVVSKRQADRSRESG